MREYTGLPNANVEFNNLNSNYRKPLSPLVHNTGNVGDFSHYWNSVWTKNIIGAATIQTINNVGSTINGDAYGTLTMNGNGIALDKDGVALPMWGMTYAYYRVAGAWVQRNAAFYFQQWTGATEIDPYSNTAKDVWFITENIARGANLDHTFSPSVDLYGTLGKSGYKWNALWAVNWKYANAIDVQSDTPVVLQFITRNIADSADVDHIFAPSVTAHGRLGNATYRWLSAHIDTLNAATLYASGLTSGRVVIAGASGVLTDDADLTFSTDTTTATKLVASTRLKIPVGTNLYG